MSNYPQTGLPPGQPAPGYPQGGYPPPQRSGCGCGGCLGKVLILLGVVFALMIALCCGGVFYLKSYVASSISDQPAVVQAISDEIISIHVPAPLEPVGGGRFKMPFAGTPLGQGAFYSDKSRKNFLVLASFSDAFGPQFKDQMLQGLQSGQTQNQQGPKNEENEELKDTKTTKLDPMIQGAKAGFNITEGTGVQSGKKKIRVQGGFNGKTGPAVLILNCEAESLPREKIEAMIKSMN